MFDLDEELENAKTQYGCERREAGNVKEFKKHRVFTNFV